MQARLTPLKKVPELMKEILELSHALDTNETNAFLADLIKARASQIHGRIAMDVGRSSGAIDERLRRLAGWRWSPLYSDRERAALAWTEALTLMADGQAGDEAFAELRRHFSHQEAIQVTLLIAVINAWNRVALAFSLAQADKTLEAAARRAS